MTQTITNLVADVFGSNALIATFLIALIPVIELKGAIPFGMSSEFWGEHALSSWSALGIAFLGSTLAVPIIALIFRPLIKWLDKYKFFHKIINFFTDDIRNTSSFIKARREGKSIKSILIKMLYVMVFVAFPVPLTGVWSGTCFAILLGLDIWQTFISVILGNFICGLIVTFVCMIFPNSTTIILYIFLALILLMVVLKFVVLMIKKHKKKHIEN